LTLKTTGHNLFRGSLIPLERTNIFTPGTYDVTDDIRMTVEATFNNRDSNQLLAPTPLTLGAFASLFASTIGVSADTPFNPFEQDFAASSWFIDRRLLEADNRFFSQALGLPLFLCKYWIDRISLFFLLLMLVFAELPGW